MIIQNEKGETVSVEELFEASSKVDSERNRGLLILGIVVGVLLLVLLVGIFLFLSL